MRHISRVAASVLLAILCLAALAPAVAADGGYPLSADDDVIQDALDYLAAQQAADGSIGGFADSAWACIAIGAAGEDPDDWKTDPTNPSLVDYLKGAPDFSGDFNMGTALARMVLAAVAAGEDPDAFADGSWSVTRAGVTVTDGDYLTALTGLHDGSKFLQDNVDPDAGNTLNDDFWAVRALIKAGQPASSAIIQSSVQHIIDNQEADDGWTWGTPDHSWYWPGSDTDDTAAAVVAIQLAGRYEGVNEALEYLHSQQDGASGGFPGYTPPANVRSTAWGVDAIGAARQDPSGSGWTPGSSSPIDYLIAEQLGNGSWDDSTRSTADCIVALLGSNYRPLPKSVGGIAETPSAIGLVLPWLTVAAAATGFVTWRLRPRSSV